MTRPAPPIDRENISHWRHAPRGSKPSRSATRCWRRPDDSIKRMYGPGTLDPLMPRRSVYFFIKRSQLIPMMMLFDWPEHLVSIGQRSTTTTAPAGLSFLNSDLARRCGEGLAARVGGLGRSRLPRWHRAYRIAFGREPTEAEARLAAAFLAAQRSAYAREGRPDPDRWALVDFCQAMIGMNEFIYIP